MAMTQAEADIASLPLRRYEDAAGPVSVRRVSWGAVFAGTALGMVFQVWLSMLGVAIGASAIDPMQEANPIQGIGIGSAIWLALSIVIASYIGGWTTGRLAGIPRRAETALHGALSWALASIIAFAMIGTVIGGILSGATRLAGGVASGAGQVASTAARVAPPGAIDQAMESARQGVQQLTTQARGAAQSGQAQQQARQAGESAAQAAAGTGWGLVTVMLLGLLAGVGGAVTGGPSPIKVYNRRP